jgi:WD40 repeat protein
VWSIATKSLESTCEGNAGNVYAVAATPDGQHILSGLRDNTVQVWRPDGTLENSFSELHDALVWALVALDNQHALSGSLDETVKLFNFNDGTVLRTFTSPAHHRAYAYRIALMPDGLRFVNTSIDGCARIVEHGFALTPTRACLSDQKEVLKARLKDEERRHEAAVRQIKEEVAAIEARERSLCA